MMETKRGKKRLANTLLIQDLIMSELHEHGAYLVDFFIDCNPMVKLGVYDGFFAKGTGFGRGNVGKQVEIDADRDLCQCGEAGGDGGTSGGLQLEDNIVRERDQIG